MKLKLRAEIAVWLLIGLLLIIGLAVGELLMSIVEVVKE